MWPTCRSLLVAMVTVDCQRLVRPVVRFNGLCDNVGKLLRSASRLGFHSYDRTYLQEEAHMISYDKIQRIRNSSKTVQWVQAPVETTQFTHSQAIPKPNYFHSLLFTHNLPLKWIWKKKNLRLDHWLSRLNGPDQFKNESFRLILWIRSADSLIHLFT